MARRSAALPLLAVAAAALVGAWLVGFVVDDAWISARYAAHLRAGVGYRFQPDGPATDGVTPLGWAHLLAPFAATPRAALGAARVLGAASALLVVILGAASIARLARDRPRVHLALPLLATSAPLLAYATSGMETPVVAALIAGALALGDRGRPRAALLPLGLAAALRPELAPAAVALALALDAAPAGEEAPPARVARGARRALAVLAPFALVALIRLAAFGRPAPLSALAKAPSPGAGLIYAAACVLLAGPIALAAPWALRRERGRGAALAAAVAVHVLAVVFAGGDWMPLSRLFVPVVPVVALAAAHLLHATPSAVPTVALALAGQIFVLARVGPVARRVEADRDEAAAALAPALARCRVVAALDVGWLGAVHPGPIVDLAGVTDPTIAALPGGHTTRAIDRGLLERRGVDCVILLDPDDPRASRGPFWIRPWARWAERYVAWQLEGSSFQVVAESEGRLRYVLLQEQP